jgi:hypothetical protein
MEAEVDAEVDAEPGSEQKPISSDRVCFTSPVIGGKRATGCG